MMPPDDLDDDALIRDIQVALRNETPAGLSGQQRAAIDQEVARYAPRSRRSRRWLMVSCALLFFVPGLTYYGLVRPEQQRVAADRAAAERSAAERQALAEKLRQQRSKLREEQAAAAVEEARVPSAAEAVKAGSADDEAHSSGQENCGRPRPCHSGKSGGKARAKQASDPNGATACDPSDPLCGL